MTILGVVKGGVQIKKNISFNLLLRSLRSASSIGSQCLIWMSMSRVTDNDKTGDSNTDKVLRCLDGNGSSIGNNI
jgi:hypothetical protein